MFMDETSEDLLICGTQGLPKISSNRWAKELQCLKRPAPCWCLPVARGGWDWGWSQATICMFVKPSTGLPGTKVSRSHGSSWVKWNLPRDWAYCPASGKVKPECSPAPWEIHWWSKQNSISLGSYWVRAIPNDLKFFKHCFFILDFQTDNEIRKTVRHFKRSEPADRTN